MIFGKQISIRDYFRIILIVFTKLPKHLARENENMIVIFKQDKRILRHIYNDHVIGDTSFYQFVSKMMN